MSSHCAVYTYSNALTSVAKSDLPSPPQWSTAADLGAEWHGAATHSYDGLATIYLDDSDFGVATALPEGRTQPSSSQHTQVQGQQQAIKSPKGEPSISHQTGVEGQQQTKNFTEGRTQPSSSQQTGVQGQPQAGSARAAGVHYPWHRFIVLQDPTNPGQWCALYHFPPGTFAAYLLRLEQLEYCWATWYPAHLTGVQLF
ncbi:hypothetical protein WJX77_009727 [Trebouxia sp. C0004]